MADICTAQLGICPTVPLITKINTMLLWGTATFTAAVLSFVIIWSIGWVEWKLSTVMKKVKAYKVAGSMIGLFILFIAITSLDAIAMTINNIECCAAWELGHKDAWVAADAGRFFGYFLQIIFTVVMFKQPYSPVVQMLTAGVLVADYIAVLTALIITENTKAWGTFAGYAGVMTIAMIIVIQMAKKHKKIINNLDSMALAREMDNAFAYVDPKKVSQIQNGGVVIITSASSEQEEKDLLDD